MIIHHKRWPGILGLFLVSAASMAHEEVSKDYSIAINSLWVLFASFLVFFMQAGFAFLEAGLHSSKNCVHVLMKNFGDFIIASIVFWAFGFALMFGEGNDYIGLKGFFLLDDGATFSSLDWTDIPIKVKFFFQLVFAGTATTIISGAIGGRFKYTAYLLLSILVTGFIYPIIGHWVWGGGWLAKQGFFDFAGSTVVHQVGGWASLLAAWYVGPRLGRYDRTGMNPYPPHNMAFVALGVMILWLGWFGFNPGSTMNITNNPDLVGHIVVTTNMGGVAGAIVATLIAYILTKKYDASALFNGLLGGLVSITAGCAFVHVSSAILIGAFGGFLVIVGNFLLDKFKVDDAVGAWPVHGLCGLWGTLAIGLFAASPFSGAEGQPQLGLFYGGGVSQLGVQLIGSIATILATLVMTYFTLKILDVIVGLRISKNEEIDGADVHEHGYRAYLGLILPSFMDGLEDDQKKPQPPKQ